METRGFSETRPETTEAIKISFRSCGNELPGKKHVHCVVVCTYLNINIPDSPTYPPTSKNLHCWRCFIVFVKQRFNPLAASWSRAHGGGATLTISVVYLWRRWCLFCMWGPQSMRQNNERLSFQTEAPPETVCRWVRFTRFLSPCTRVTLGRVPDMSSALVPLDNRHWYVHLCEPCRVQVWTKIWMHTNILISWSILLTKIKKKQKNPLIFQNWNSPLPLLEIIR